VRPNGPGTGHAFALGPACKPGESLTALSVADDNETFVTGDSAGRLCVWGAAGMVAAVADRGAAVEADAMLVRPRARWRAHTGVVVSVRQIPRRGALLTASVDCSVVLWTMGGAKLGVFGQEELWNLDSLPAAAMGEGVEGAVDSDYEDEDEEGGGGRESRSQALASFRRASLTGLGGGGEGAAPPVPSPDHPWQRETNNSMSADELRKVLHRARARRGGTEPGALVTLAPPPRRAARPPPVAADANAAFVAKNAALPAGSAPAAKQLRARARTARLVQAALPQEGGVYALAPLRGRRPDLGFRAFAPRGWAPDLSRTGQPNLLIDEPPAGSTVSCIHHS